MPALFILSLALAGLLACLCQYILLQTIKKEVPKLENQVIGFADKVINSLNNASEQWAIGTNGIINDTSNHINDDVFGWVNTTTFAVNNTLHVFVDGVMDVLNVTFGGTILYEPVLEVLNCLVLLKIAGIEKGLTWVSDHAHIDFPLLPNNTFSLGTIQKVSGSEADILAAGPNSGAADAITGAMFYVIDALERAIRQEAIISTCVLLIWVIIVMVGILRSLFVFFKGGDEGIYGARSTPSFSNWDAHTVDRSQPSGGDKFELSELPRVPTYEQATSAKPGDHAANRFNGQSYTLAPRPLPTFEVQSATSPILHTGFRPPGEKLGSVAGSHVDAAIRRPAHTRQSSHGDYVISSPPSGHPDDPFRNPIYLHPTTSTDHKANPFADPPR